MRYIVVIMGTLLLCGCSSRGGKAQTAADVWHMGHAMTVTEGKLPAKTVVLMGQTLKQIADKWSEDLGIPLDKTPTRRLQK